MILGRASNEPPMDQVINRLLGPQLRRATEPITPRFHRA